MAFLGGLPFVRGFLLALALTFSLPLTARADDSAPPAETPRPNAPTAEAPEAGDASETPGIETPGTETPEPSAPPVEQRDRPAPGQEDKDAEFHKTRPGLFDGRKPLGAHWDEGLWLVDKPERFTMKLNFRMDLDWVGIHDDDYVANGGRFGNTPSHGQLRRARVTLRGELGPDSYWKTSFEVTDDRAALRDNFLQTRWLDRRFGSAFPELKIGNFFEPLSLEQNTPSGRLTFMSRSAATQALGIGRSLGIMASDQFLQERVGYDFGLFTSAATGLGELLQRVDDENLVVDGFGITGRLWWMPWGKCRGPCRRLLLGASFSERVGMTGIQYRARPESHVFDHLIDTDFSTDPAGDPLLDDASDASLLGFEAAWTHGSLSAQAEYYVSRVSSVQAGSPTFHGGYAMVSYWLTGECRNLGEGRVRATPICNPVDTCKPLNERGLGGVEVAVRYSRLDLNNAAIRGGKMNIFSAELNWHFAARRRLMFNFTAADVNDGIANDVIWIFQTRFQLEF